jgi:hypothetical protein
MGWSSLGMLACELAALGRPSSRVVYQISSVSDCLVIRFGLPLQQPSAAFDERGDALLDTEGHNFTARWLLALAAIYDGATRTSAAKLGGTILSGYAAKQTARRPTARSKARQGSVSSPWLCVPNGRRVPSDEPPPPRWEPDAEAAP